MCSLFGEFDLNRDGKTVRRDTALITICVFEYRVQRVGEKIICIRVYKIFYNYYFPLRSFRGVSALARYSEGNFRRRCLIKSITDEYIAVPIPVYLNGTIAFECP